MKMVNLAGSIVAGLCLLLLVFVFLLPALLGWSFSTVEGGSMEPELSLGEVIAIQPVEPEEIKPGDIVSFKFPDKVPITHRVVEVIDLEGQLSFQTKGDANEEPDPYTITSGNLIGQVKFQVPYVGYFSKFIDTQVGAFILVIIPGMIIIGAEMRNMLIQKPKWSEIRGSAKTGHWAKYVWSIIAIGTVIVMGGFMAQNGREITVDYDLGEANTSNQIIAQRVVRNGTSFPSIVCLLPKDSNINFSENHFVLGSGEDRTVDIVLGDAEPNKGSITYERGSFLPMLPASTINSLASWNFRLSPFILSCVPVIPLSLIGYLIFRESSSRRKWQKQRKSWRKAHV